jgi:N-acetyl-alpha-D-muramate 1-phosphate uridylyltransferase
MQKAMILAAGLGTRLQPITHNIPKALVELNGKSLLQRTVDKLIRSEIRTIVINIHHFPGLMRQAIENLDTNGVEIIISDESDMLLDTGGAILKAAKHLSGDEPFLVHNVDIISDISIPEMLKKHTDTRALATIAVSNRSSQRYFLWDNNRLCGWQNIKTGEIIRKYLPNNSPEKLAFSCIHIINPIIFELMDEQGVFSINDVYLRLAESEKIMAYRHDPANWADIGTIEKLRAAEKLVLLNPGMF